jgi:methylase of polypeptide subunit release factors
MHIPSYPPELEAHWVETARGETRGIALRDVLHRIEPDIVRLANRFTTERKTETADPSGPYLKDTRSCAAYSLFFAPQTHARLTHILAELTDFPETPKPLRILDLGCGTGAAS